MPNDPERHRPHRYVYLALMRVRRSKVSSLGPAGILGFAQTGILVHSLSAETNQRAFL